MHFCVLHHVLPEDHIRGSHWDLLLQFEEYVSTDDKCLISFESPRPPDQWCIDHTVELIQLPNHRAFYLDYSGQIDGNRGCVVPIAAGTIHWQKKLEGELEFVLVCDSKHLPIGWTKSGVLFRATLDVGQKWKLLRLDSDVGSLNPLPYG